VVLAQVLLAATVAGPVHERLKARLDSQAHAPALGGHPDALDVASGWADGALDWSVLADLRRGEAPFFDGIALALVWVALAAWVFGALVAGGFLDTADMPPAPPRRRVTSARFLEGGGRWFWRCLRVGLCFAAAYAIVGRVVFEVWATVASRAEEEALSQAVGWRGRQIREGAFLGAFLLLRVVADLARARLVVFRRRSAAIAFLRSFPTLVRHPIRALGLGLVAGVLEVLLLVGCGGLLSLVPGGRWWEVALAFLAFQAAVLVRWAGRATVLAGYVHLHHAHAGAPLREEPAPVAEGRPVAAPASPVPAAAPATVG
jgi:hypothetical protein